MPSTTLSLQATKSHAYFESLSKHFARKVAVQRDGNRACITFPMGECTMSVHAQNLRFDASAADSAALEAVQTIITSHVLRFSELKDAETHWQ
ncbi:MAG: DUF2218 domain-containing protein [Rhodocyclaceae bacterium]|nr:DUF2218 domain-containing protein [Rhodocyclaceae bacterium]